MNKDKLVLTINPDFAVEIYSAKSISSNSSVSSNFLIKMVATISSSKILAGTLDFIELDLLVIIPTAKSGFKIFLLGGDLSDNSLA